VSAIRSTLPGCRNKRQYAGLQGALKASLATTQSNIEAGCANALVVPYRCEGCGTWHIGRTGWQQEGFSAPAGVLETQADSAIIGAG